MKTIGELKDKLKKFSDTEEESFLKDDEICCFINMAISKANQILCGCDQDYNTSCEEQDVAACTESISLPEDIMGTKIKKIIWKSEGDCGVCCELKRLDYDCMECDKKSTPQGYQFFNKKGEGQKLYLSPQPDKDGVIRIIYSRKPCEVDEDTDPTTELENPEMCNFIFFTVLALIYQKEKNPLVNLAIAQANEYEQLMIDCLCPQWSDEQSTELTADSCWKGYVDEC